MVLIERAKSLIVALAPRRDYDDLGPIRRIFIIEIKRHPLGVPVRRIRLFFILLRSHDFTEVRRERRLFICSL